jgi:hypothetical protein
MAANWRRFLRISGSFGISTAIAARGPGRTDEALSGLASCGNETLTIPR